MRKSTVQHTPFRPARKDLAEICFLTQWQALNAQIPDLLPGILGRSRCDLRSARIAASFIVWIGSTVGASFIEMAKSRIEDYTYAEPAYLATWALVNQRKAHVNCGVRAIEVIMSADNLFADFNSHFYAQKRASNLSISLADIDVIESMVSWLSTPHADAFVSSCMAEYQAMRALERSKNNVKISHAL
jgi:hypothetical protein